jgi:MFS family permease
MTSLSTPSRTASTGQRAATWAPLAVILCGTFVYVLDFFVVNVALPSIQRDLAASSAAIEWVVAGYGLTSAAFLVTGGRLGDHYGRRKLFCIGIATFTVTSALCAAAPGAGFLVAARLAQGVGAAIMAPNVLSILGTTYAGPARVKAISIYGMVMGFAAAGGQLLGGLTRIPGIEAAVAVHDGPPEDIDRTYGALGTAVAQRAIGVDGPIREYYPDGFDVSEPHRTEICWPVFLTSAGAR